MATGGDWKLTDAEIASLAEVIAAETLETIALKYLGFQWEEVDNLKREHRGNIQAFNRDILQKWAWKNLQNDQVKVLASILYKAERDGGYVNVDKVQEILRVPLPTESGTVPTSSGAVNDTGHYFLSEEVTELQHELKNYIEETSATPLVPWVDDYLVDMKDTYVDLSIEKIENKLTGPKNCTVENYTELFSSSKKSSGKGKARKVLAKGDPGMGKTTFGMKVAFDWATGVFNDVSIVFPIALKFVRPGDSIENIIIQQTPPVEALEISEQKLTHIFDTIGDRAMIILDGLDEHELGNNEDIQKIIEGRKLFRCNVLLTSRPHCTEKIERYFPTVVKIEGFTKERARLFVSKHLKDKDQIDPVLKLNAENFISKESTHSCPMLLLFICVLVNYDELPLTQKVVHVGEIFARLVRCVFSKYCARKNMQFQQDHFVDILKRIGKLAWEMLHSNQACTRRNKVIKQVGEDCFGYGFLIGQKSFKIVGKETSDIYLTFVHRTIQEFLGVFFFALLTDKGEPVYTTIFFQNRLCLRFHLWFLSNGCEESFFAFRNRKVMRKNLISVTAKHYDSLQIDFVVFSRTADMDVLYAQKLKDDLLLRYIQDVLSECHKAKELYLNPVYPIDWVLESMHLLLPSLQVIGNRLIREDLQLKEFDNDSEVAIVENTRRCDDVRNIVKICDAASRIPSLYLEAEHDEYLNLSNFVHQTIGKLYIFRNTFTKSGMIAAQKVLQISPLLRDISFVKLNIDESILDVLSEAIHEQKLPALTSLSFEGCRSSLKGKLYKLFWCVWSTLTHLDLGGCDLDDADLGILMRCLTDNENKNLPVLTSLVLHSWNSIIREKPLTNITVLKLCEIGTETYQSIAKGLNQGMFPNLSTISIYMRKHNDHHIKFNTINAPTLTDLTLHRFICSMSHMVTVTQSTILEKLHKLDISHSSGISGTLSILLSDSLPSLNSLILSDCGLNSQDLCSLAQASAKGRLPELRHLDISRNPQLIGQLHHLFAFKQKWQHLLTFSTQQDKITDTDWLTLVHQVQSGSFSSLNELRVSTPSVECLLSDSCVSWAGLELLHVFCESGPGCAVKILEPILGAVERKLFPNLTKLYLTSIAGRSMANSFFSLFIPQTQTTDLSCFTTDIGSMMLRFGTPLVPAAHISRVDMQSESEIDEVSSQVFDQYTDLFIDESLTALKSMAHATFQPAGQCLSDLPLAVTESLCLPLNDQEGSGEDGLQKEIPANIQCLQPQTSSCDEEISSSNFLDQSLDSVLDQILGEISDLLRSQRASAMFDSFFRFAESRLNETESLCLLLNDQEGWLADVFQNITFNNTQHVQQAISNDEKMSPNNLSDRLIDFGDKPTTVSIDQLLYHAALRGANLRNHPAYRSAIRSMTRSMFQLFAQCEAESRPPDVESMLRICQEEIVFNPSLPMSDQLRSLYDAVVSNAFTNMKPFLLQTDGFPDFLSNDNELIRLRRELGKQGVFVYMSEMDPPK